MDANTRRQDARRRAKEARSGMDEERKAREKRLEDAAVTVLVSLAEAVDAEGRAGEALRAMVEDEGLTLREAVAWCNDGVTVREATRLKRLASEQEDGEEDGGDPGAEPDGGDTGEGPGRHDAAPDQVGSPREPASAPTRVSA